MPRDVILTPEGLTKLKDELEHLQTEGRREVAERIKEAREFGDISENSEYDDAKNAQAMLETKIAQHEERIRAATVVDPSELSSDVVGVGSTVHVKDEKTGKSQKFTIVGSAEANPAECKLSATSRRSAARCSATSATTWSPSRSPRARRGSSRSPRSTSASRLRP